MVPFQLVMVPLSKALGLSLVVERVVEFGKNVLEPLVSEQHARRLPDPGQAAAAVATVQQLAERDRAASAVEQAAEHQVASRAQFSARLDTLRGQLLTESDGAKRVALLTEIGQLKDQLATAEQAGDKRSWLLPTPDEGDARESSNEDPAGSADGEMSRELLARAS